MSFRIAALFVPLVAASAHCLAQQADDFPDAGLTRQQWQERVADARRRSEDYIARIRTQTYDPRAAELEERQATDRRVMNDPTLRRGDIVSTSQGLFVFSGRDEAPDAEAFQPADRPR